MIASPSTNYTITNQMIIQISKSHEKIDQVTYNETSRSKIN